MVTCLSKPKALFHDTKFLKINSHVSICTKIFFVQYLNISGLRVIFYPFNTQQYYPGGDLDNNLDLEILYRVNTQSGSVI